MLRKKYAFKVKKKMLSYLTRRKLRSPILRRLPKRRGRESDRLFNYLFGTVGKAGGRRPKGRGNWCAVVGGSGRAPGTVVQQWVWDLGGIVYVGVF